MTDARSLQVQINDICSLLARYGAHVNYPIIRDIDGNRSVVSWTEGTRSDFFDELVLPRYLSVLRSRSYTALMPDGGLIQLSYVLDKSTLINHRLAFWSAPFQVDPALIDHLTIEEFLEISDPTVLLNLSQVSASIRFDYDPANSSKDHPASHLTVGPPTCRVPVTHPLYPSRFIKLIIRNYYPAVWADSSTVRNLHEQAWEDCLDNVHQDDIVIACRGTADLGKTSRRSSM